MFDVSFGELVLVLVVGLVVLGPERLPTAIKTVSGWLRSLRTMAASVQNELNKELKLNELHENLNEIKKESFDKIVSDIKEPLDDLQSLTRETQKSWIEKTTENPSSYLNDKSSEDVHEPDDDFVGSTLAPKIEDVTNNESQVQKVKETD